MKVVATNKFANFNYFLLDSFEAGIALKGSEVKSVRKNGLVLNESFVLLSKSGVVLKNSYIKPYQEGSSFSASARRDRALLLNKNEILKIKQKVEEKGLTIVPVKAYFKDELLKLEIAIARGKKLFNKKEDLKERDIKRDTERMLKE